MAKDYKILKLFIPILVTIYIILVSLVIGLIEEKVIAYWYHTLLVVVAYVLVIFATMFLIRKIYYNIFPESKKYSFTFPKMTNILGLLMIAPFYTTIMNRVYIWFYRLMGNAAIKSTHFETISEILLFSITAVFLTPVLEELVFRFMTISPYKTRKGKIFSLLSISLLFGFLHFHNSYSFIESIMDGLLYGLVFLSTRNIFYSITLHFAHNLYVSIMGILINLNMPGLYLEDKISIIYSNNYWIAIWFIIAILGVFLIKNAKKEK